MKHLFSKLCISLLLTACGISRARASVALFLEEPFGHFGAMTATGHAAVYLPRICAETPVKLRRCDPGEAGVVLSRYNAIGGHDWIAIPLIPYLYSVESARDIPLFANAKLASFLRQQYRRRYLQSVAADAENGEPPTGNWIQLVGAAYDRTIYSYEIVTTEEQDDALIRDLNTSPNRSHFHLLSRNCADFARRIVDFYYPRSVHRNIIADLGITTPKQLARTLVKYEKRHPGLESSSFVIPQVPGSLPRSTAVYGVLESFLKSKKYLLPLAAFHPFITGGVAIAYLGSGRFDPAKQALVLDSSNKLRPPLAPTKRRNYEAKLNALMTRLNASGADAPNVRTSTDRSIPKSWSRMGSEAEPNLDATGHPVLEVQVGEKLVDVGLSRQNIVPSEGPSALAQTILAYRLHDELRKSAATKAAESDIVKDWNQLNELTPGSN
jgi:hypothetical protein